MLKVNLMAKKLETTKSTKESQRTQRKIKEERYIVEKKLYELCDNFVSFVVNK